MGRDERGYERTVDLLIDAKTSLLERDGRRMDFEKKGRGSGM